MSPRLLLWAVLVALTCERAVRWVVACVVADVRAEWEAIQLLCRESSPSSCRRRS